jgi:hypothetical protein
MHAHHLFPMAACGALAFFAGCATELRTVRVTEPEQIPPAGAPYNLTFTQYEITITRRLSGCSGDLTATVEATAINKEVRDPSREYVIDFAALRSFFKTSNIAVEYHPNGALKSVNASAEDKSATVASSVIKSFATIAGMRSTEAAPMTEIVPSKCSDAALAALANIPKQEGEVAEKTKDLERVTADLERLTAIGAAMGKAWGTKERNELASQINLLYKARLDLSTATEALKKSLGVITVTTKVLWPTTGETRDAQAPIVGGLSRKDIEGWGIPSEPNMEAITLGTAVWPRLRAITPIGGRPPCMGNMCKDDEVSGLKYRMQVPGELLLCTKKSCEGTSTIAAATGPVSQLGPVLALPLKNYPFMKQSIEATFDEAGQPTKLGYKDEAAAAEGIAGVFGTLVDEVAKVREARKPKTELEKLKEETELLKAKQELAAAKKALDPPKFGTQAEAVAAFTADTSVLQAELAKLQAEAALAAAQAQAKKP